MVRNVNSNPKVIFTGGHARATGFAVIEEIQKTHPNWELYWAGSNSVIVGKSVQSIESKMFPSMGVQFLPVISGRLQRRFTFWTLLELLKIPIGFIHAIYYLYKIKPSVVVSFGGFVSAPFAFASKLTRTVLIVHEQTTRAGRANIFGSFFAKKILLARRESSIFFDKSKTKVIGNPVSMRIRNCKVKKMISKVPTLLITGGASGSQKVNDAILKCLPQLLKKYSVIHQTGDLDFKKFNDFRANLPEKQRSCYLVFSTVASDKWPNILLKSDIIVSRAGANIVSEIAMASIPAILIPIPFAFENEQLSNARWLEKRGICSILTEKELTADNLMKMIERVRKNWKSMVEKNIKISNPDREAHTLFVNEISEYIKS